MILVLKKTISVLWLGTQPIFELVPTGLGWLHTTLAMAGKAFITGNFNCIYHYTAELFPTTIRQFTLGSSVCMGAVGGLIAPYMGQTMVFLHLLIYCITTKKMDISKISLNQQTDN